MAPNEPLITAEYFGEILVLRIKIERLFDESTVRRFYDEASAAIGHRSRIVLDLEKVMLMSSSTQSKLTLLNRQISMRGGRVLMCCLQPKVRELFRTSQLDRLWTITRSQEEALASLSWTLGVDCPIVGCGGDALTYNPSIAHRGGELCCRSCGCRFQVAPFQLSPDGEMRVTVSGFKIPTYESELIRVELGRIVQLHMVGRLDLFAAEPLVAACRSLPGSWHALLDLRAATEVSDAGLRLLADHHRDGASCDRIVVLADTERSSRIRDGLSDIAVATTPEEATSILDRSPQSDETPAPLLVSARVVEGTMGG